MLLSSSVEPSIAFEQVLETLGSIALQLQQFRDVNTMLDYGVRETRALFEGDRVLVYQFLPDGQGMVVAESVGDGWQPILGQLINDSCFQYQWTNSYEQGWVSSIADVEHSNRAFCYRELLARFQVKANLVVPIGVKSSSSIDAKSPISTETRFWGLLIVHQCHSSQTWHSLHIQVLRQIAIQIGLALQQLERYQSLERSQHYKAHWWAALASVAGGEWDCPIENEVFSADLKRAERQQLQTVALAACAIIRNIHQSLDLNQIVTTAVTEIRHCLQADRVIVYRLNSDWTGTVIAESVAPTWLSLQNMRITDSCFVENRGGNYHTNSTNVVADIYAADLSPCHIQMLERLQVRANLMVPILDGQRTWGLLIAHQCGSSREWQPPDWELMSQLAACMAIAIQHAELYQQLQGINACLELQIQERTAQLQQSLHFEALLKCITDNVRNSLDEQQILQTVVKELVWGLPIAACDIAIYNAECTVSTIVHEFTNTLPCSKGYSFKIGDSPHPDVYLHLLTGRSCQFCDISPNVFPSEQQLLTTLACPIQDEKDILGDLWLFKPSQEVFNDLEVRLVHQVANQCGIALRQSRLYKAAQEQVQELERLNYLKDDFLSTVSHELRTPMTNIKMATQMLGISLQSLGLLVDETNGIHRYFHILEEQGNREIHLINDLLELTRLDAETEPLNLTLVDLRFLVPHIAEPFIQRMQQHQQHFTIEIPDNFPTIITHLSYIERSLTELLHNACKYTPIGEHIHLWLEIAAATVTVSVSNSGVEIPKIERDRIFDKFYRIPNHDPWQYGGTGLGLALIRRMTCRMGGMITVDSGQDKITTFTIHLPIT